MLGRLSHPIVKNSSLLRIGVNLAFNRFAFKNTYRKYSYSPYDLNSLSQNLIPVINRLQEVTSQCGTELSLDLPQMVVVGAQSSGKSSVLESLVGKEFLPRGTGIVTRCPLILQLNKIDTVEYAEFSHLPGEKFFDFKEVSAEIQRKTNELTGTKKGVTSLPIILRVYSPNVIPLTLVDTPGFTKIPVGDQPSNIQHLIEDMVSEYISNPNSLILAVHPANQDFSLSDGVSFALKIDKSATRTIGVLTKLDIIDKGVDPLKFFNNTEVPLKLGYYAVVNRNQLEINNDKPISKVHEDEKNFFSAPVFSTVQQYCGIEKLALKCNELLTEHIRAVIPKLRYDIEQRLEKAQQRQAELGEALDPNNRDKKWMLMQILNSFNIRYSSAIDGSKSDIQTRELAGGARIRYIFDDIFKKKLQEIKPTDGISLLEYKTALRNATGSRPSLFVPDGAFEILAKKQIKKLHSPALQAAELVLLELERIISSLDIPELNRFNVLRDAVVDVCNNTLRDCHKPTVTMINNLIDCELAYINTSHPDFLGSAEGNLLRDGVRNIGYVAPKQKEPEAPGAGGGGIFSLIFGNKGTKPAATEKPNPRKNYEDSMGSFATDELSEHERIQIGVLQKLLASYIEISKKNIHDGVTKAIWHFLVNQSREKLSKVLISEIYQQGELKRLMKESPHVIEERKAVKAEIDMLNKAHDVLTSPLLANSY